MADYLKALYVADELLLKGRKIYIWGNDEAASGLFVKLCALSIKIDGFVSDEWCGTTLWHRPVVALKDADISDAVLCIPDSDCQTEEIKEAVVCHHPVILNPEFDKKQAVIYGAGMTGGQVLRFLQSMSIEVCCFIDSDRAKVGSSIEGVSVENVSYLKNMSDSAYVVEAGYFYKEIDKIVTKYLSARKRFYWEKPLDASHIEVAYKKAIIIGELLGLANFLEIGKYYFYGVSSELAKKYQAAFELMEIYIDEVGDVSEGATKSVEDLLYEDNYLILIGGSAEEAKKSAQKLKTLGMREGKEYVSIFYGGFLSRKQKLDLNLGYTYIMDKKYAGFQVLGKDNKSDYRIVVLGGSTTDGGAYPFKSWADYLYEKCAGYDVTIFNGGISGYTSTQELIKLLRDVMNLYPDMIIVYDGVNDVTINYRHKPYSFPYLESVFSAAAGGEALLKTNHLYADDRESFDIWIGNIEFMHAIAQSKGVEFFSFLQPMLCSKEESSLSLREKTIIREDFVREKEYVLDAGKYRRMAKERRIEQTHDYMYDLSDIFDKEDVYMDHCHVCEDGNKIIAYKIWEKVADYIMEGKK